MIVGDIQAQSVSHGPIRQSRKPGEMELDRPRLVNTCRVTSCETAYVATHAFDIPMVCSRIARGPGVTEAAGGQLARSLSAG